MTIENSAVIDAIGTDKALGSIHLSIFAHLPWDEGHLLLLQEKLNLYLGFIESGEIYSAYPEAIGRDLMIDVITRFRPTPRASTFLEMADAIAKTYGARVRQLHAGSGYVDDPA